MTDKDKITFLDVCKKDDFYNDYLQYKPTFLENIQIEIEYIFNSISTFFKNVQQGIKNIIYYLPVIWNDRYYDYEFILILLNKKLIQMRNGIKENDIIVDSDKIYRQIDEVLYQIICYQEADDRFEMSNQDLLHKIKNETDEDKKDNLLHQYCLDMQNNEQNQWNKIWDLIRDNGRNWWD